MRQLQSHSRKGITLAIGIAIMAILFSLMISTVSAQTDTTTEQFNLTATAVILMATGEAEGTPITTPFPPTPAADATVIGFIEPIAATATAIIQQATMTAIAAGITGETVAQAAPTTDNTASTLVLVLIVGIVMAVVGFVIGQRQSAGKRKNS